MPTPHIIAAALFAFVVLAGPVLLPGRHQAETASTEIVGPNG